MPVTVQADTRQLEENEFSRIAYDVMGHVFAVRKDFGRFFDENIYHKEIARRSGGDSMPVHDAYALETTLSRLRQRYALYFNLPAGVRSGEERSIEVSLADSALRRNGDAEVRYRRVYLAQNASAPAEPMSITRAPVNAPRTVDQDAPPVIRRRAAANDDGPRHGPLDVGDNSTAAESQPAPRPSNNAANDDTSSQGGWRRARPDEK